MTPACTWTRCQVDTEILCSALCNVCEVKHEHAPRYGWPRNNCAFLPTTCAEIAKWQSFLWWLNDLPHRHVEHITQIYSILCSEILPLGPRLPSQWIKSTNLLRKKRACFMSAHRICELERLQKESHEIQGRCKKKERSGSKILTDTDTLPCSLIEVYVLFLCHTSRTYKTHTDWKRGIHCDVSTESCGKLTSTLLERYSWRACELRIIHHRHLNIFGGENG